MPERSVSDIGLVTSPCLVGLTNNATAPRRSHESADLGLHDRESVIEKA